MTQHRSLSTPATVCLVLLGFCTVALTDHVTGVEVRIYPLYFLPLGLAASRLSLPVATGAAIMATMFWATSRHIEGGVFSQPVVWLLNTLSQFIAFEAIVVLVHRLRQGRDLQHLLARTDPLTGLANARSFHEVARRELQKQRSGGGLLSIAYLDLDHFKRVNDELGHLEADRLLLQVGNAIVKATRQSDVSARLGGDEFAILLPGAAASEVSRVLERLQKALQEAVQGQPVDISFSMGAVTFTQAAGTVDKMLAEADALMYSVKAEGRNAFKTRVV